MEIKMKRSAVNAALLICALSFIFIYNNCSPGHDEGSANASSTTPNACDFILKAEFEANYLPFLRTNCAACHATGPGSGLFASGNRTTAYSDFMWKTESRIADFSVGPHQPAYTGPQLAPQINLLRPQWQSAQDEYNLCLSTL